MENLLKSFNQFLTFFNLRVRHPSPDIRTGFIIALMIFSNDNVSNNKGAFEISFFSNAPKS
jgi:hypothetical protein